MTKAEIQLIKSLGDKRGRMETGLFVAEGEKLVGELLASDFSVRKIYFTDGNFAGADSERISPKEMERISHLKTPAECLALVGIPQYGFDPRQLKGRLTLALDGVQNPGNMGTIIRLADWFGIESIVCSPDTADCFNPKVVQATMGAVTRVRVHYGNLAEMIAAAGVPVFGTFLEGENIYDVALPQEGIIVLGNEGQGISTEIEKAVTRRLFIPPYPGRNTGGGLNMHSESLNVAVAAAIVCSEFRRRG